MIRHVVLMTFKEDTTDADRRRVSEALDEFASKLDYVLSMQHGPDIGVPTPSEKTSYGLIVDFATVEDCARYDDDPGHDVVRSVLRPLNSSVARIDLEV